MKEILTIENWGVTLYCIEETPGTPHKTYRFDYGDTYSPGWHSIICDTLDKALWEIITYLLNANNVYDLEDQPDDLRVAYDMLKGSGEARIAAETFLYYVLEGIAHTNMRKE